MNFFWPARTNLNASPGERPSRFGAWKSATSRHRRLLGASIFGVTLLLAFPAASDPSDSLDRPRCLNLPPNPDLEIAKLVANYKPSYWDTVQNRQQGMSWGDAQEAARQHYLQNLQRRFLPARITYATAFIEQTVPDGDPRKPLLLTDPLDAYAAIQQRVRDSLSTPKTLERAEAAPIGNETSVPPQACRSPSP
jgi:hypothetical protein